jgi:L-lactate dehydrogenase complex protein LldG
VAQQEEITMHDSENVMERVRRSLKREQPLQSAPVPPTIHEPIARLVSSDIGLPELFSERASELKMLVEKVRIDDLQQQLTAFLQGIGSKRVMLTDTPLIKSLDLAQSLSEVGFEAKYWSQITLDESYDFDAGVTEVDFAVAESGTLVVRHRPEHGRAISLVPFVHVAIVQPKNFVPDLIDLMERLQTEGTGSGVTMISGPSKTADIELNVVTGVHGPNIVKAFILS